jgi:hypothetical protein
MKRELTRRYSAHDFDAVIVCANCDNIMRVQPGQSRFVKTWLAPVEQRAIAQAQALKLA